MGFDLESAKVPQLTPLAGSFAVDDVESELRDLFVSLFKTYLGEDAFDANVAGMMHLGTFDLVRKAVNFDGLTLTDWQGSEEATRYLYRAWKSRNQQGRGLHFLRVYLQMLFPNVWNVYQQWHPHDQTYPNALEIEEADGCYLTSRVQIAVDGQEVASSELEKVRRSIQSVIPARFVPDLAVTAKGNIPLGVANIGYGTMTLRGTGALVGEPIYGNQAMGNVNTFSGAFILNSSGTLS